MIISASYRTDIPAFYGRWFRNRFRAGWCSVVNPYGGGVGTIPLRQGVDGFVFWTRNAAPFAEALEDVAAAGYPFVVQYTVTGYPRALETSVVPPERAVADIARIVRRHGQGTVVWRYDPIVAGSLTPPEWHLATFRRLADMLAGLVDEVVISHAHIYRKTERNMRAAARAFGFSWHDPEPEEKREMTARLAAIAARHGMTLGVCSQPEYLAGGAVAARCVDATRLAAIGGRPFRHRVKGNRPGCECAESRDIGAYDTCPHGCVYCYAVSSRTRAKANHARHDPDSPFLLPPAGGSSDSAGRDGLLFD